MERERKKKKEKKKKITRLNKVTSTGLHFPEVCKNFFFFFFLNKNHSDQAKLQTYC